MLFVIKTFSLSLNRVVDICTWHLHGDLATRLHRNAEGIPPAIHQRHLMCIWAVLRLVAFASSSHCQGLCPVVPIPGDSVQYVISLGCSADFVREPRRISHKVKICHDCGWVTHISWISQLMINIINGLYLCLSLHSTSTLAGILVTRFRKQFKFLPYVQGNS